MQGNYPHRIAFCNDNPENAIGKFGHLAQSMLQTGIELIILDNVRPLHGPLDPCQLNLPLGDTPKSVLRILKVTHLILLGIQSNAELDDGRCQPLPRVTLLHQLSPPQSPLLALCVL